MAGPRSLQVMSIDAHDLPGPPGGIMASVRRGALSIMVRRVAGAALIREGPTCAD